MSTKNEKAEETTKVDYIAWSVEKRNGKTYWTRVGVAFKPHKDGEGSTRQGRPKDGVAISGGIVFRKPRTKEQAAFLAPAAKTASCTKQHEGEE